MGAGGKGRRAGATREPCSRKAGPSRASPSSERATRTARAARPPRPVSRVVTRRGQRRGRKDRRWCDHAGTHEGSPCHQALLSALRPLALSHPVKEAGPGWGPVRSRAALAFRTQPELLHLHAQLSSLCHRADASRSWAGRPTWGGGDWRAGHTCQCHLHYLPPSRPQYRPRAAWPLASGRASCPNPGRSLALSALAAYLTCLFSRTL